MSYYFPHDYDALNDDKLLQVRGEFGTEGYALFWMCLETMAKNENSHLIATLLGGLSLGYGVPKDRLVAFLNFCVDIDLFKRDETGFYSERMLEHKECRNLLSVSGKKGAEKRWNKEQTIAPPLAPLIARKEKKRKEIKEPNPILATPEVVAAKDEVNEILSEFQMKLNPTINYGNKTQRNAVSDMLKLMGKEKLLKTIEYAAAISSEQFAPIITTPYQLKEKMAQLVAYYQKQNNKKPNGMNVTVI